MMRARGALVQQFGPGQIDAAVRAKPDRVVVAGGDGTIGCAALAGRLADVPLAVIPIGTANDFARALGIPLDPERAVAIAIEGNTLRTLDLGRFGERPFVNAASAGLSPVASRRAEPLKPVLGPVAYSVAALGAGLFARPVRCRVRADGCALFSGAAWQVMVALTGAFGGGAEVEADPRDGVLDVVVIEAGSRLRLVAHAYGMRSGRLEGQTGVRTASGRQIDVETDGRTGFNVDGELIETAAAHMSVEPRAYEVVTG